MLIAAGLTAYAYFNLSSIVAHNEKRMLARVSDALGRQVQVGKIQAQMGWGVSVEVSGLTIADDPAFSTKPFVAANDVSIDVEFFPLLYGEAKVVRLELIKPNIRIVMDARGELNLSTVGASPDEARKEAESARPRRKKRSSLADLAIKALTVTDGAIYFNDLGEKMAPIHVRHLDFDVTNFNAASAFEVETKFAFAGDNQNVAASGKLGPILERGVLDGSGIPVDLNLKLDSIVLDSIRPLADVGQHIPPGLSIPDPVSISGTAQGSLGKLAIALNTDLTAARVAYATIFNKPSGTAMTVDASGTWGASLDIASINLKLSDLELTASRFSGGGAQPLSAQIDTNSFNLANLGPMITAAAGLDVAGMSEIHGTATIGGNAPAIVGSVALKQVALKLGTIAAGRDQRSEQYSTLRRRSRSRRADEFHLRRRARESRRTSRVVESAQSELFVDGRLGEAGANICQPSRRRRDQRVGSQRCRGRRDCVAANQCDDPIDQRIAPECFVQQSRYDRGLL